MTLQGYLGALDEANDEEQNYGADGSDDDAPKDAATERDTQRTKEEAADEGANDTDNEVTDKAEATALDQGTSKPACYQPDDKKPQETQSYSLNCRQAADAGMLAADFTAASSSAPEEQLEVA